MEIGEMTLRLGISLVLGMIIGLDRELRRKPLGVKTCAIMAVSCCLMTIISIEAAEKFAAEGRTIMDPMRLAAQILPGVGFLASGVILRRSNDIITGLTTGAMLWGATGLGIAVGAGFYVEAAIAFGFIMVAVEVIPLVFRNFGPRFLRENEIRLKIVVHGAGRMTDVLKEMEAKGLQISNVRIEDLQNDEHRLELRIHAAFKRYITDVYYDVKTIDGVTEISIEKGR